MQPHPPPPPQSSINNATSMGTTTDGQILQEEPLQNGLTPSPLSSFPLHPLLLLSDSALPLGSFAFSSGLESYLAHHPPSSTHPTKFPHFLSLTVHSLATTTLPYLLACHRNPSLLPELDDTLDASTLCPVARRASVAQGRALLTLWERALKREAVQDTGNQDAAQALNQFSLAMKKPATMSSTHDSSDLTHPACHLPLVWALVTRALNLALASSTYLYLFNHAKAVVSAAVRASVMGPYAAQGVLASGWLQREIEGAMEREWEVDVGDAAQGVPMWDVWVGRHELLYSRIFNS